MARLGVGLDNIDVGAATAVAWAPPAPQAGLCGYYTDSTQWNGFWDTCP